MVHAITSIHKPVARTCYLSPWNYLGTGRWGTVFQGEESDYGWAQEAHTSTGWVTITRLELHCSGPPSPQAVGSLEIPWPQDHTGCQIPWPQDHTYILLTPFLQAVFYVQFPPAFLSHLDLLVEKLQFFDFIPEHPFGQSEWNLIWARWPCWGQFRRQEGRV